MSADSVQYRGYYWILLDYGFVGVYASAGKTVTQLQPGSFSKKYTLSQIAYHRWQYVSKIRRIALNAGAARASVDGVPWEIHEIKDEIAYEAALAAFKDAQQSDP